MVEVALDPAKVAGKIVLCDRGVTARVNKAKGGKEGIGCFIVPRDTPGVRFNQPIDTVAHRLDQNNWVEFEGARVPAENASIPMATMSGASTPRPSTSTPTRTTAGPSAISIRPTASA